ncbi:hypothetical protein TWF788_001627 [Orbilia oligospora]|uniref:Uncharacterized protein n=1 Tax=Orbilia oligospora TaxID=2813651 RepID=A0A7C8P875_ORBOL|nr:hypothetical protein TWF788_001627 [Orbilia oligospora]
MCLVKVRGEVEDDVIVPARVVERESVRGSHQHQHYQQHSQQRETQIVSTAPAVIERPARSHRYSSSSSSNASSTNSITSSRSSMGYAGARHERRSRRYQQHHAATASSYDGRSYDGRSHDGRSTTGRSSSRSRERGYYREQGRVVSGGSYDRRGSYRYVDPQPRGSNHEKSSAQKNTSKEPQNSKSARRECEKPAQSHTIQDPVQSVIEATNTVKTVVEDAATLSWSKRQSDIEIVIPAGSLKTYKD